LLSSQLYGRPRFDQQQHLLPALLCQQIGRPASTAAVACSSRGSGGDLAISTLLLYPQVSAALRPLLREVITLYALYRVERDVGWLVAEGLLPPQAGHAVPAAVRELCASLAPHYR
jgi:hypothetical protein